MPSTPLLDLRGHDTVAIIAFAQTGYPRLTQALLHELQDLLREIRLGGLFRGVVIAANARSFATGAAIDEVTTLAGTSGRSFSALGQKVFAQIGAFPLPVVAAIRGYCLGGGFDLALACHARVATYDSSLGYPGGGSRDIQWGWNPIGGGSNFDVGLTPNYLVGTTSVGTVTVTVS